MWSSISHKLRSCSVVQLWWIWGCFLLILLDPKMLQGPLLVILLLLCTPQIFRKYLCLESFLISNWYWLNWKIQRRIYHNVSYTSAQCYLWFIAQPRAKPAPLFCPWNMAGQLLQKAFFCFAKPKNKFENAPIFMMSWAVKFQGASYPLMVSKVIEHLLTWTENAEAAS